MIPVNIELPNTFNVFDPVLPVNTEPTVIVDNDNPPDASCIPTVPEEVPELPVHHLWAFRAYLSRAVPGLTPKAP